MTKQDFLAALRSGLAGLPEEDLEERLTFYSDMIDDRMEDGLSEAEAVAAIGSVEEVISQIMSEIPLTKLVKERVRPKHTLRAWEIVLLVLGSPIWLSLLIAAAAVLLAIYAVAWSVIVSLWAAELGAAACVLGALAAVGLLSVQNGIVASIALLGVALVCAGVAILLFFGCKAACKGILHLTKKTITGIKTCFVGKGK